MEKLMEVTQNVINGELISTVNGRLLYQFLGIKDGYAHWIKDRIIQYKFVINQDFSIFGENPPKIGKGRPTKEYFLSFDMAKELSMVERTEKGKQARQYFIECERALNKTLSATVPAVPMLPDFRNPAIAARAWADQYEQTLLAETQVKALTPKAEQFDAFMDGSNYKDLNYIAKTLGTGRTRLFRKLREERVLLDKNIPYQRFIDNGYFVVRELPLKIGGSIINYSKTYVTPKGESFLYKILNKKPEIALI